MRTYHHLGIPTTEKHEGEVYLVQFKTFVSGFEASPYGIEWMRYEPDAPLPELVKTVPHIAFEVDDLAKELEGKEITLSGSQHLRRTLAKDCAALEDLGRIAHKIKGSAGYFNLTELGELARTLKMQCKAGEKAGAAASIEAWVALVAELELRGI